MNIQNLEWIFSNEKAALAFSWSTKLIDSEKTCNNNHDISKMGLIHHNTSHHGVIWRCSLCKKTCSILKNSIFDNSKLEIGKVLKIIYFWAHDYGVNRTAFKLQVSQHSVSSIFRQIKRACYIYMNNEGNIPIGGEGKIVEIDETLFSKRKFHKGRILNQIWIFGGICRDDNMIFLEQVPNRNSDTLMDSIQRNINVGTTIISDEWKAYNVIENQPQPQPYCHQTVNHSKNFVDPVTLANTQKGERLWRDFKEKKKIINGVPREDIDLYIAEFRWRRLKKIQEKDLFLSTCNFLSTTKFLAEIKD